MLNVKRNSIWEKDNPSLYAIKCMFYVRYAFRLNSKRVTFHAYAATRRYKERPLRSISYFWICFSSSKQH